MDDARTTWLIKTALRCYPAYWRRRHGDEATELAALLLRDGTPAAAIALSYLVGATRAWLTPRPGRRLSAVACALLAAACSAGASAVLLASTMPAKAASTSQPAVYCRPASPVPAPEITATTPREQIMIREAWHDRSC